jgi:hypothetical protein
MQIAKIAKWGPCQNLSDVCTFLGNIGICCIFIQNFSKHANPLVQLMHKGTPFKFSTVQAAMQDNLKKALLNSPALCSIDYTSDSPVILAVDTSPITIGFYLCQADPVNPQKHYFAHFRSILLNDCKHCFSQPKLELYGLFCTLHVCEGTLELCVPTRLASRNEQGEMQHDIRRMDLTYVHQQATPHS